MLILCLLNQSVTKEGILKPPVIIADNSFNFGQLGWGHAKSKFLMYPSIHLPSSHDGITKLKNPEAESVNRRKKNSG